MVVTTRAQEAKTNCAQEANCAQEVKADNLVRAPKARSIVLTRSQTAKANNLLNLLGLEELAMILAYVTGTNAEETFSVLRCVRVSCKQLHDAVPRIMLPWSNFFGDLLAEWNLRISLPDVKFTLILQNLKCICAIAPGVWNGHAAEIAGLLGPMAKAALKAETPLLEVVGILECICAVAPELKRTLADEITPLFRPMVDACEKDKTPPLELVVIAERLCALAPSLVNVDLVKWDTLFVLMVRDLRQQNNLPVALDCMRRFLRLQPVVLRSNVMQMILVMLKFSECMIGLLHNEFSFDFNIKTSLDRRTMLMEAVRLQNLAVVEELVLCVFSRFGLYEIDITATCIKGRDVFYYLEHSESQSTRWNVRQQKCPGWHDDEIRALKQAESEQFKQQARELLSLLRPERRGDRRIAQHAAKKAAGHKA